MTRWEDLTELEQAAVQYSDMHKAAFGFRPRNGGVYAPQTLADYDAAFDRMAVTIAENEAEEAARAAKALERVRAELATLEEAHGIDRATALRWWFEAEGADLTCSQDREHTLWKRGIAFRDFPEFGESAY